MMKDRAETMAQREALMKQRRALEVQLQAMTSAQAAQSDPETKKKLDELVRLSKQLAEAEAWKARSESDQAKREAELAAQEGALARQEARRAQFVAGSIDAKQLAEIQALQKQALELSRAVAAGPTWPKQPDDAERARRTKYADEKWPSESGAKGIKGNTYVMYGPPDEVKRAQNGHEVWVYQHVGIENVIIEAEFTGDGVKFTDVKSPSPQSQIQKSEIDRRIRYARERFDGESTDRGKLYIQVGPPDEIESHPGGKEIWRYKNQGGGVKYEFDGSGKLVRKTKGNA